jgi:hypothetical protein
MSTEQAETVLRELGEKAPEGLIFHGEGPLENGGTWVMDSWESPEKMQAFLEQKLGPIMQKIGITPPQAQLLPQRIALTQSELRRL